MDQRTKRIRIRTTTTTTQTECMNLNWSNHILSPPVSFIHSSLSLSCPPPPHRWCDSFVCLLVSVALWLEQQTTFPIITRRTPPVHTVRYIHALWHPANGVWRIVVSPSQKLAVWLLHAATANCYMLERYLINSHKNLIMRLFRNNPSIIAF